MAQRPKAKPKRRGQKNTDKKQSERFIQFAREMGADESGEKFERAAHVLIPTKKKSE
jgi:hypothetical protein